MPIRWRATKSIRRLTTQERCLGSLSTEEPQPMASLHITRCGHTDCHDPQPGKLRRVADGVRLQYHAPKQVGERCLE